MRIACAPATFPVVVESSGVQPRGCGTFIRPPLDDHALMVEFGGEVKLSREARFLLSEAAELTSVHKPGAIVEAALREYVNRHKHKPPPHSPK